MGAQLPNFYQAYQEGVENSQANAQRAQALQIQKLALDNARAQKAKEQQYDQMVGFEDPFVAPAPPPGQASVPMQQPGQQMPPPIPQQAPPQGQQQPMPPQPPGPPPGIAPGMGMPPPQMSGGAINAQMQPGGPPQPQQRPIPPYQSVQALQQRQAPPQPQPQQAGAMPPPPIAGGQQSGMPPPIPAAQSPEQAAQMASAQIMKLAAGPDAYTTMKQNVVQHLVANGVPPQQAEQQAARYLANSPVAQTKLKALEAQRKEALDITTKAQDAADKAFRAVLLQQSQGQTKLNEDENRAETKVRDANTAKYQSGELGIQRERLNIEKQKSAAGAGEGEKLTPGGMKVAAELTRAGKPLPGGWSAKGMARGNAVLNQMAEQEEGGAGSGSIVGQQAKYKANSAALTQNTKDVAAILPYKEMLDTNADIAIDLGKKVIASNSKLANKSINWVKSNMADNPDTADYLAQIHFVQTEASRVLANPRLVGQLTDSARKDMQEVVDGNMPINSTERVLTRIKTDGNNRVNALIKEGKKLESDVGGSPSSGTKTVNWSDLK